MRSVYLEDIGQYVEFPDDMSREEVQHAIETKILPQHGISKGTSVGGGVKEFGKAALDAVPRGTLSILRGISSFNQQSPAQVQAEDAAPQLGDARSYAARNLKQGYDQSGFAQGMAANPGYEDSLYRKTGAMIGGAVPYMAAGAVGGAPSLLALGALQGAGTQGELVDEARQQGRAISGGEEDLATGAGGVIGALASLPMMRLTNPIQAAIQGTAGRAIASQTGKTAAEAANAGVSKFIASMAVQAGLGGGTGALQQAANNLVERGLINPDRKAMDSVMDSAVTGALGGAILDATVGHLGRKAEAKAAEPKKATQFAEQKPRPALAEGERALDMPSSIYPEVMYDPAAPPPAPPQPLQEPGLSGLKAKQLAEALAMREQKARNAAIIQDQAKADQAAREEIVGKPLAPVEPAMPLPKLSAPAPVPEGADKGLAKLTPQQQKQVLANRAQAAKNQTKPMYSAGEEAPLPAPESGSTATWQTANQHLGERAQGILERMNLPDVGLRLKENLFVAGSGRIEADGTATVRTAEGQFEPARNLLTVARMSAENPQKLAEVLNHEAQHAVESFTLATPKEINAVNKEGKALGLLDEVKTDPYYATLTPEQQMAEVRAKYVAGVAAKEFDPNNSTRSYVNKTKNLFRRVYNGAKGEGFFTAEDYANRLREGEIGTRNRPNGIEVKQNDQSINAAAGRQPATEEDRQAVTRRPDFYQEEVAKYDEATVPSQEARTLGVTDEKLRSPQAGGVVQDQPVPRQSSPARESTSLPVSSEAGVSGRPSPEGATRQETGPRLDNASQSQAITPAQEKVLSLVDSAMGEGKRKDIATLHAESGLPRLEFEETFRELVKQDRIQSSKGDMPTEAMVERGHVQEGNYVHDPVSGKPYITAVKPEFSLTPEAQKPPPPGAEERFQKAKQGVFEEPEKPASMYERLSNALGEVTPNKLRESLSDANARLLDLGKLTGTAKASEGSYHAKTIADNSQAMLKSALEEGFPVYKDGFVHVEKGSDSFLQWRKRLEKSGLAEKLYAYQIGERGYELDKQGREKFLSKEKVDQLRGIGEDFPQVKEFAKQHKAINDKYVDFLEQTGYLNKESAADWKSRPYIPFMREAGDTDFSSYRVGKATSKLQALKGGVGRITDPEVAMIRNYAAIIDAGAKNVATNRAVRDMLEVGWARPAKDGDHNVVTHRVDGKKVQTQVMDRWSFETLNRMNLPPGAFGEFMSGFAHVLRNAVTRNPTFMLKNIMRDSVETAIRTDYGMIPFVSAADGAMQALRESPHYKDLERAGVVGGAIMIDSGRGSGERVKRMFRKDEANPMMRAWDKFAELSEKSEAANRVKIYEDVLKRTGDKAQASWEARDVMNFSKRGSNSVIRLLTPMVPFMNARIQGLDMLTRTIGGTAFGGGQRGLDHQKAFVMRAGIMALSSLAYAQAISSYKFWENAAPEERDNYWFIPTDATGESAPVRIPVPFEIGAIFKMLPERLWANLAMGKDTNQDTLSAVSRALINNLAEVPIPQAIKPLAENYVNKSFYRGRPLENQQQQALLPEDRWDDYTSMLAREAGAATGQSPIMIDNVLKGYTGTIGMFTLGMLDRVLRPAEQGERPADHIWNTPGIGAFFQRPDGAGKILAYYEFDRKVDEVFASIKKAQASGNVEKIRSTVEKHKREIAAKSATDSIGGFLKDLRKQSVIIRNMHAPRPDGTGLTAEQKKELLDTFRKREIEVSKQLDEVKKQLPQK